MRAWLGAGELGSDVHRALRSVSVTSLIRRGRSAEKESRLFLAAQLSAAFLSECRGQEGSEIHAGESSLPCRCRLGGFAPLYLTKHCLYLLTKYHWCGVLIPATV